MILYYIYIEIFDWRTLSTQRNKIALVKFYTIISLIYNNIVLRSIFYNEKSRFEHLRQHQNDIKNIYTKTRKRQNNIKILGENVKIVQKKTLEIIELLGNSVRDFNSRVNRLEEKEKYDKK